MAARENLISTKKTAKIVGALFIIATVMGVLSALVLLQPILTAPDYLVQFSKNENKVILGVILDLIGAGAFVGIAVVIFPILKKHHETIALGYVVTRSFEAVPFIIGNTFLISLLALGQEYVRAGTPDASNFQTLGTTFLAAYDWTQLLGPRVLASLAAVPFYYLFYKSKLLPRWISVWGLIGAPLYLAAGLFPMFGFDPSSPIFTMLFIPAALLEMVLAVWLIVKGFNPSVLVSRSAE